MQDKNPGTGRGRYRVQGIGIINCCHPVQDCVWAGQVHSGCADYEKGQWCSGLGLRDAECSFRVYIQVRQIIDSRPFGCREQGELGSISEVLPVAIGFEAPIAALTGLFLVQDRYCC